MTPKNTLPERQNIKTIAYFVLQHSSSISPMFSLAITVPEHITEDHLLKSGLGDIVDVKIDSVNS